MQRPPLLDLLGLRVRQRVLGLPDLRVPLDLREPLVQVGQLALLALKVRLDPKALSVRLVLLALLLVSLAPLVRLVRLVLLALLGLLVRLLDLLVLLGLLGLLVLMGLLVPLVRLGLAVPLEQLAQLVRKALHQQ